jgi:hypothetical protein
MISLPYDRIDVSLSGVSPKGVDLGQDRAAEKYEGTGESKR